jgi:hypothetical protein
MQFLSARARGAIFSALVACGLGLATAGCLPTTPTSHVANGESFTTGQEKYDSFFASVAEAKKKADSSEGEQPLRKKVATALGLDENAKTTETLDAAKSRASDLKKDGAKFYVVLDTEAKLVVKAGGEDKADTKAFVEAVGDAMKEGVTSADELTAFAHDVEGLEAQLPSLEGDLATTFPEQHQQADVKLELDAAKQVLEKARLKAESESGRALRFSVMLAGAVDSGAAGELLAMAASKGNEKPKKAVRSGGKGGGKVVKAKPKQDFDP